MNDWVGAKSSEITSSGIGHAEKMLYLHIMIPLHTLGGSATLRDCGHSVPFPGSCDEQALPLLDRLDEQLTLPVPSRPLSAGCVASYWPRLVSLVSCHGVREISPN